MKFILLFLLSFKAFAYIPDQVKFSDLEYNRYIKPQLRSILFDYQTLIFTQNTHLQNFKSLFSNSRELLDELERMERACPLINEDCISLLKSIEKNLRALFQDTHKATVELPIQYVKMENFLRAEDLRHKLADLIFQNIERVNTVIKFSNYTKVSIVEKMIFELKNIFNLVHLMSLELVDYRFQKNFSNFWVNFGKPIQLYVLIENQSEYLKYQLNQLNISLHELHVGMTKRNKTVTNQTKTILNTIDMRWRSILKIIVR